MAFAVDRSGKLAGKRKWIAMISSFLLFALFAYSGISKILDFREFHKVIGESPLLTGFDSAAVAKIVVSSELTIATLLIWRRLRLFGMYFALLILVLFTLYLIKFASQPASASCGCGGFINNLNYQTHMLFNCVCILVAIVGCLTFPPTFGQEDRPRSLS